MLWLALITAATAAAPWAESMATGDCAAVLSALPAPATDPERLAAARCALRTGDSSRAESLAGQVKGPLATYAASVQGEALLARGEGAKAAAVLAHVELPGDGDTLLRARALLMGGSPKEAASVLGVLTGELAGADGKKHTSALADEALWWLGQAREGAGDTPGAVSAYRRLWAERPSSGRSDEAATRLAALGAAVPDYATMAGRELAQSRARTLRALSLADKAVPLLDGIDAVTPFASTTAQRDMADTLFAAKLYARAAEWYRRCGAATSDAKGAFQQALATARSGDYPGAADQYRALAARWPTSTEADEATWKPAYMDFDAGRLPEAIKGFTTYLAARPTGRFAADARWFRAWSHHRLGEEADALAGYADVIARHGTTEIADAARYWRARSLDDKTALAGIARDPAAGGYAWFAADRVGLQFLAPQPTTPRTFSAAFLESHPSTRTALQLLDAGMPDLAQPLLTRDLAAARAGGESTALPMADAMLRAEAYRTARELASAYCSSSAARDACHPRPYAGMIRSLADAGGLTPLLPYAIMNAESGLDPKVTSPAGARGLMQMMPELARARATDAIPGFAIDDLYLAGINARVGTMELVELQRRLGSSTLQPSLPLVIAAYNGGPEAVERWLAAAPAHTQVDEFAENISFTETRRYVRRVLGYLMEYRRVYGDR